MVRRKRWLKRNLSGKEVAPNLTSERPRVLIQTARKHRCSIYPLYHRGHAKTAGNLGIFSDATLKRTWNSYPLSGKRIGSNSMPASQLPGGRLPQWLLYDIFAVAMKLTLSDPILLGIL